MQYGQFYRGDSVFKDESVRKVATILTGQDYTLHHVNGIKILKNGKDAWSLDGNDIADLVGGKPSADRIDSLVKGNSGIPVKLSPYNPGKEAQVFLKGDDGIYVAVPLDALDKERVPPEFKEDDPDKQGHKIVKPGHKIVFQFGYAF